MNYHAHIYYDEKTNEENLNLFKLHEINRSQLGIHVFPRVNRPVGPHPLPMFEVHFNETQRVPYLEFLQKNIGSLSALIHEDTGDDVPDHSTGAKWLGTPLSLDFYFFELIKKHPSKKVHP